MALDLGRANKRSGGGNGGGTNYSETIAVEFIRTIAKDPKQANPAEDYAEGYLLHPVRGLNYQVDAEGNPSTVVKFKTRERPKKAGSEHTPLEVYHLPRKKDAHQPVKAGGIVVLEGAYYDEKNDFVMARWLSVSTRDPESPLEMAHVGYPMSVDIERYTEVEGEKKYRQRRYMALTDKAQSFVGRARPEGADPEKVKPGFEDLMREFLVEEPNHGGGRPSVSLRIVEIANPSNKAETMIYLDWIGDENRLQTPQEAIDAFYADPDNAQWVDFIEASATETGYVFEATPILGYGTGTKSLPSKNRNGRDDGDDFRVKIEQDGQPVLKQDGTPVTTNGYAVGTMVIKRQDQDAVWYATRTFRQDRFGPVFMRDELITRNLLENHPEVAQAFQAAAERRGKQALEDFRAQRTSVPSVGASQDQGGYDGDVAFGEPDHSNGRAGLTPR